MNQCLVFLNTFIIVTLMSQHTMSRYLLIKLDLENEGIGHKGSRMITSAQLTELEPDYDYEKKLKDDEYFYFGGLMGHNRTIKNGSFVVAVPSVIHRKFNLQN